jgi:hypothetical protein
MGVASGDQPLKSPLSDTRLAQHGHVGRTKVTFTAGTSETLGASATTATFSGNLIGSGRAAGFDAVTGFSFRNGTPAEAVDGLATVS